MLLDPLLTPKLMIPIEVGHMCIGELGCHWFKQRLAALSARNNSRNHCWIIVNWTPRNHASIKFNWNSNIRIVVYKMATIFVVMSSCVCARMCVCARAWVGECELIIMYMHFIYALLICVVYYSPWQMFLLQKVYLILSLLSVPDVYLYRNQIRLPRVGKWFFEYQIFRTICRPLFNTAVEI